MKAILIIFLVAFTLCEKEKPVGGWEKRSFEENSFEIDRSFKLAAEDYIKSNKLEEEEDVDDLIGLTVYSQVVAGTNYKLTFMDRKAEFPVVHEYTIYVPLRTGNKNDKDLEITEHNEYQADNGLVPLNDPVFETLENKLYKYLKGSKEELQFISYVYPMENKETNFYKVNGYTSDGDHQYILCQDKESEEFYSIHKIK